MEDEVQMNSTVAVVAVGYESEQAAGLQDLVHTG